MERAMGLFGKKVENEKFTEIEHSYKALRASTAHYEELVAEAEAFIELCESLTTDERTQFNKVVRKQSKRDRGIRSYEHPIFGLFFDGDDVIGEILWFAARKRINEKRAIATRNEYERIEDISPTFNDECNLERHRLSEMPEIKIKNITKSFDMDAKLPAFIVIDTETTGLKPTSDRIIQICAMRYELFEPIEAFVTYINPGKHIPEEASKVNGLHDEDVQDAPPLSAVADSLLDFIGTTPIVGYNIAFDLQFLFCSGIDLISKRIIYDAKALAKKVYKGDMDYYSLENVLAYNGVSIKEMHDAKIDCFSIGLVFKSMLEEITSR